MARTKPTPISITVSSPKWGTVVWVPNSHTQKHLHGASESERKQIIAALKASLKSRLEGAGAETCAAVNHVTKRRVKALVDLEQATPLTTGGLSGEDDPSRPFVHGAGV